MTTEQKDMPEWWDEFCDAVRTRTLDRYECSHTDWPEKKRWDLAKDWAGQLYEYPHHWTFRKRVRTVNINGVDLVAPVLAGDVVPRDTWVFAFATESNGKAENFDKSIWVFTSASDRDAMRAALMGVKP